MDGQPKEVLEDFTICSTSIAAVADGTTDHSVASLIFLGARIRMTLLGAARNPHFAGRQGTVVGRSRINGSVRILFDGRKTPISLYRDYVETIALF